MTASVHLDPGPIVVASHNRGKAKELEDLLAPHGFDVRSAADMGLDEPEETGATFEENAILKARVACEASGLPSLADDSGLGVTALNGEPGIYSARWAGPERDFSRAMRVLEEAVQKSGSDDRSAAFVCVLALALPGGVIETFTGRVEGALVWPPRGDKGFGYDPVFLPEGHERTFGEMDADEKHGWRPGDEPLSHRARAFARFADAVLGR